MGPRGSRSGRPPRAAPCGEPGPHPRASPSVFLGNATLGFPSCLPSPAAAESMSCDGKWKPQTKSRTRSQDQKIKIHSRERRNDNRTTETEIKTISALHVVCGFVCTFYMSDHRLPSRVTKSLSGSLCFNANQGPGEDLPRQKSP